MLSEANSYLCIGFCNEKECNVFSSLFQIIGTCFLFLKLDMTESFNETDHTCLPSSSGSEVSVKGMS